MDAGLIVAIVALLLAAFSLRQSMAGRRADIQIQTEQRRQEVLGVLRQAQISSDAAYSSVRSARLFNGGKFTTEKLTQMEGSIIWAQENTAKVIKELEDIQGGFDSSYLVALEKHMGDAQHLLMVTEQGRGLAEDLSAEMLETVSGSNPESDSSAETLEGGTDGS